MTKAEALSKKSKKEEFDFEKDLSINKYKLVEIFMWGKSFF